MNPITQAASSLEKLRNPLMEEIDPGAFFLVLLLSVAAAFFVALLYRFFFANRETGSQIHRSFALLGLAITAIFICIQFSLPLSLGLLGALSIVRFRTPIKEPEEIGFLMVVIATSLAAATFNFVFLGIILSLAVVTVLLREYLPKTFGGSQGHGLVLATFTKDDYRKQRNDILHLLGEAVRGGRLESITTQEDEIALTYSFRRLKASDLSDLESRLGELAEPRLFTVSFDRFGA